MRGRGSRGVAGAAGAPGAPGPAPAGSAGDDVYLSASGVAASRTPAAARAAHDASRRTTYTTSGWTLEDGGSTGAIAVVGSIVRATMPTSTALQYRLGTYDAPRMRRALTSDPWAVDVRVRLAAATAGTINANSCFGLAFEHYDGGGVRRRLVGGRFHLASAGGGAQSILEDSINGATPIDYDTAWMLPVDGTGWARGVIDRQGCALYGGIGTGTGGEVEPAASAWVPVGVLAWTTWTKPHYPATHLTISAQQYDAGAGAWTLDVGTVIETTLAEV